MAFNTEADVRRILKIDSGNEYLTSAEITSFLTDANNDLFSSIKKQYERERYVVNLDRLGNVQTEYGFSLSPVVSIYKVYVNNVEKTVTTDYTFDNAKHTITFLDNVLNSGDSIEILYLPKIYHLAELYLCAYNIMVTTNLVTENGTSNPIIMNLKEKKDTYMKLIKNRAMITAWR